MTNETADPSSTPDSNPRRQDLVALLENSLNEIYVFDRDTLRFIIVNRGARLNLGYSIEELTNMTPIDIKPEFDLTSFRGLIEPLRDGRQDKVVLETLHSRKDGSTYPVEVHLQPGRYGDRDVLSAIILDITKRREAENKHRKLDEQIRHAQKLESLGILAGGIAHDFNNILTSILGYADLARSVSPQNSEIYSYVNEVTKAAQQASELTRQMLAYAGKGTFVLEPVDLNVVIREMGRLLDVSISKNAVLRYELADSLPAVQVDASQIRQVVMNLIVNASEAIGEQRGIVSITTGPLYCDEQYLADLLLEEELPAGHYVYLEVADNGHGMTEDVMEKIFDPFFSTKFTGRGLGLSAVLGIARSHHGAIKVYSEPGKGSSFRVLLPATKETGTEPSTRNTDIADWRGSGTVLIVDDEPFVRQVAREMMQKMGFAVIEAEDGAAGVEAFREHADELTLVLLDVTMPKLDGAGAFHEMRQIRAGIPTILTSGYNQLTAIAKFSGKGLAGFIQKPFLYADLAEAFRSVLTNEHE